MLPDPNSYEPLLKKGLAARGFELVKIARQLSDGALEVEAYTLHAIPQDDRGLQNETSPLHVPVPVTLKVTLDSQHSIVSLQGGVPTAKALEDAGQYARTLMDNGRLEGLQGVEPIHPTHRVELNERGQRVIRRKNFSAF